MPGARRPARDLRRHVRGIHGAIDLRALFSRQLSLLGSYMGTRADLDAAWAAFGRGGLAPVVDSVLPLADAAEAHRRLETHSQFGKVVLQISTP